MIGHVLSQSAHFRGVVRYILGGGRDRAGHRVAWSATRNLTLAASPKAATLMAYAAKKSRRCESPCYHLAISWRKDERPTDADMHEAVATILSDLGLSEHQTIYARHTDRGHHHVHIVFNRVHPRTGKVWHTSKDYARIEQSIGRQAKAKAHRGFQFVPGRHNTAKTRGVPRNPRPAEIRKALRENVATRRTFAGNAKADIASSVTPHFQEASSWYDLVGRLRSHGLHLETKGQGLILTDSTFEMKLSDLGRDVRLKTLVERFSETWSSFEQNQQRRPTEVPTPSAPLGIQWRTPENRDVPVYEPNPVRSDEVDFEFESPERSDDDGR